MDQAEASSCDSPVIAGGPLTSPSIAGGAEQRGEHRERVHGPAQHWIDRTGIAHRPMPKLGLNASREGPAKRPMPALREQPLEPLPPRLCGDVRPRDRSKHAWVTAVSERAPANDLFRPNRSGVAAALDLSQGRYTGRLRMVCSMDRALWKQHLVLAEKHVAVAERIVGAQKQIVAELQRDGHSTDMAQRILKAYEDILELHIADCERLKKKLATDDATHGRLD
ncbi:MAG: hypothetical protein AB7I59_27195 [Geminicoccaceae bacterium]|uniref:hypothetical protein n=1 Tax=Reyranella sp. TaxID=1929291 RepID=UPI003D100024